MVFLNRLHKRFVLSILPKFLSSFSTFVLTVQIIVVQIMELFSNFAGHMYCNNSTHLLNKNFDCIDDTKIIVIVIVETEMSLMQLVNEYNNFEMKNVEHTFAS